MKTLVGSMFIAVTFLAGPVAYADDEKKPTAQEGLQQGRERPRAQGRGAEGRA